MKKVERHLYEHNGRYYFRRRLPQDVLWAFAPRKEIKISLKTDSLTEALKRLPVCEVEFDACVSEVRPEWRPNIASNVMARQETPPFDPQEVERAARAWLKRYLDVFSRKTPIGRAPSYGDPELSSSAILEILDAELQLAKKIDWEAPGASARIPLRLRDLTDHFVATCGFNLEKDSQKYLTVSGIAFAALNEAIAQQKSARAMGEHRVENEKLFGQDRYVADLQPVARKTFGEIKDGFLRDPSRSNDPKTLSLYRARLAVLEEALGGETPIDSIDRQACRRIVEDVLPRYPRKLAEAEKALPLSQRLNLTDNPGRPPLSRATQNLYIDALSGLFAWAQRERLVANNPAEKLRVRNSKAKRRLPFSEEQLRKIFAAPIFTGCVDDETGSAKVGNNHPRRHRFWVPIIALYSGMRLNEICQLEVADIKQVGGVPVFQLWADEEAGRTLKNSDSARLVPIHPTLVELGFLEYVASLPKGSLRLFPDLTGNPNGSGADPLSKWFSRLLSSVGVKTSKVSFHSFRHNFRDAVREAGIPLDLQKSLGGWSDGSVDQRYGAGHSAERLSEAMSRVAYRGLDLTELLAKKPTNEGDNSQ